MLSKNELSQFLSDSVAVSLLKNGSAYEPEVDDLYFLYCLVREKAVVSILEIGSGWSTLVLAKALAENLESFGKEYLTEVRFPNPFKLLTIDASKQWQEIAIERLPLELRPLVIPIVSEPILSEHNGILSHKYDKFPNFIADLIYLDGPDHDQVKGNIRGFQYNENFLPPMAADLLAVEPFMWPETFVVTDGRGANATFLRTNFKRNWQVIHDRFGDRTLFRLDEIPFGSISEQHIDFRLEQGRNLLAKEIPHGLPDGK
jgi:hypothetical protein